MLKAKELIFSYKELAELMEISKGSFYNWLNGYFDLSIERQKHLQGIIAYIEE